MKKFLSLVLALVMTMSLVTISAGATEYKDLTDKDDLGIQYQEAVAVLNKIGVITGYDDGSFRPDVELTRGAAAKIIVSMLLGPEAASNLPNNAAPYPDVPANHTFAGVISYCKNSKIINGYSDGTFKPSDTLTGFAFAKMLLGALGYDNAREGLSGAGWTMNVASLGQEATLFDRIDFKGGDPVTRKDAALLALNTLKATVVEYKGGSTITVGDAQAVVNSERTYKTSNQDYARNILPQRRNIQNDLNSRADYNTVEFAEEHFVDLRLPHDKYSPTRDEYGRPSAEWSYKKLSIGTFPLEPDFEYTTQVIHAGKSIDTTTDAAKVRALGLSGYYVDDKLDKDDGSSSSLDTYTNLWINGVLQDSTGGTDARLSKTAEIADYTDNGTLVQVYVDNNGADRITDVVVIKTQMMEVRRVGSDYVSLDLYKDHSDADGKILYGYNDEPIDVAVNNVETGDDYFEFLSGLKVGDLVAVEPVAVDHNVSNKRDYDVGHAYTPETVSGALTNVETYGNVDKDRNAVNLTVGGTKYPIALWNRDLHSIDPNTVRVTTKDITLHMDKYGNAMVAKNIGATKDWMVIGNYRQSIVNGILVTFANGWDIDGKAVSLNVGAHNTNVGGTQGVWNNGLPPVGSLVYYTNSLNSNTAEWDLHWQTGQTDGKNNNHWSQVGGTYDGNKYGVFDVWTGENDTDKPNSYDLSVNSQRINLVNYGEEIDRVKGTSPSTTNDLAYRDNGIKFIYITMDESGEVDSIEVKSGMQRTSNAELKGTSSRFMGTVPVAQACVALKDGKVTADSGVKAVVIKSESNAVSLRNLLYITNTDGEIRREDGTVYQKYEVAMYNESGKLENDRHIEIWSDRLNLAIGSFARYTKMDNATFENFYSLRPYGADAFETRTRSVAVARTNLACTGAAFVGANNNLIRLAGADYRQDIARSTASGYAIETYHDRDHNIINGEQKEFAYNLVDFRGAEFIDMTGKNWDIENVDDLKEAYNKSFDFYKLDEKNEHRDINVTLLFNDNPENDGFRQVYLVVVNSVSAKADANTSASTDTPAIVTFDGGNAVKDTDFTVNKDSGLKVGDVITFTLNDGVSIEKGDNYTVSEDGKSVTITGSPAKIVVNKASATETNVKFAGGVATMNGAQIGFSGASVDTSNDLNVMYNLTAPKWIGSTATATIKAEIKVNGIPAATKTTVTSAVSGGVLSGTEAGAVANVPAGATVEVTITEVTYTSVKATYKNAKGEDITTKMVAAGSAADVSVSGSNITVKYPTTDSTNAPTVVLTSGTTAGAVGNGSYTSGTKTWDFTVTGAKAAGTDGVVITIGDANVTPTSALTLDGTNVKATGNKLSSWGVTTATDGALEFAVALSANAGALKDSDNATVTLTNGATALSDAFEYEVSITLDNGYTSPKTTLDKTANGTTVFTVTNITEDTKVTGVTVTVKTEKLAVKESKFNDAKTTLTVTFNMPVDETTAKVGFTITAGTHITAGASTTYAVSGDTVTISVVGGTFTGGASIPYAATIQAAGEATNTVTAGTIAVPA